MGIPLEEANALAGLGRCALAAGHTAEAEERLRRALAIFQRIGSADTTVLSAELDALHGTPICPQPMTTAKQHRERSTPRPCAQLTRSTRTDAAAPDDGDVHAVPDER